VPDGVDLFGRHAASAQIDEDGGAGLDRLVDEEQAVLGLHDEHARAAHAFELGDCAGELALEGASVVGALDKVGYAEVALVEDLEADALPARQALAGEVHAEAVDLLGGNKDGGAAGLGAIRDVAALEVADNGGGVLLAEAAVEQLVVGTSRPAHKRRQPGDDDHRGDDQRDALVYAEMSP
jgi:hypothetical protein